jgi:hypothetical protein
MILSLLRKLAAIQVMYLFAMRRYDLLCDAFLCPAKISRSKDRLTGIIFSQWRKTSLWVTQELLHALPRERPWKFKEYPEHDPVVTVGSWPTRKALQQNCPSPNPFLVAGEVSLDSSRDYAELSRQEWHQGLLPSDEMHNIISLMQTLQQFLVVAIEEPELNQPTPATGRERNLLALPVLGTGYGLAGDLTGQIVTRLMYLLSNFVVHRDNVDVAVVCADEAMYHFALAVCGKVFERETSQGSSSSTQYPSLSSSLPCFLHLAPDLGDCAIHLARLASKRQLSLFMGAGVSIGSGLPEWFGLLHIGEGAFTPSGLAHTRENLVTIAPGIPCKWQQNWTTSANLAMIEKGNSSPSSTEFAHSLKS